jgi:hypothetical protein
MKQAINLMIVVLFSLPRLLATPTQDYRWWWRSFLTSGCTALYLLLYCVHFFMTKLDIKGSTSTFLYFGYTAIMVFLFLLLTGKPTLMDYPQITYYWTVPLILDHLYLVRKLTSLKIADTKV